MRCQHYTYLPHFADTQRWIPEQELEQFAQGMIKGRHQENTIKQYDGSAKLYKEWCKLYNKRPCPLPYSVHVMEHQLMLYLAYMTMTKDVGWSSLNSNLYAIKSYLLEEYAVNMHTTKEYIPRVKGMIRNRRKDIPTKHVAHIDNDRLFRYFQHLKKTHFTEANYRFMFALKHNTMRRSDEVLARHQNPPGLRVKQLTWENGSTSPHKTDRYVAITFNRSKTNIFGEEQHAVVTCICPEICALCELTNVYKMRAKNWDDMDPLIVIIVNGTPRTPTYDDWRNKLQTLNQQCGLKANAYTLHGCRGGGQDDAKRRGLSLPTIMQQSGWRSLQTAVMYERKRGVHKTAAMILREQNTNNY